MPTGLARQLVFGALGVLACALLYWWMSAPVESTALPRATPTRSAAATSVLVDVIGDVRRPGVVRLPAGARVVDAVAAAGGLRPGRAPVVNMAREVVDGEQIVVGATSMTAAASTSAAGGRVSINSADVAALDALPGVGAVIAQRIIDYREQHGPFRTLRDLLDVPGIGDAKYADLADAITL